MTQENKELLLKDLCGRLSYEVKVHAKYTDLGETIELDGIVKMIDTDGIVGIEVINDFSSAWTYVHIDDVKPYLFPLSSMTKEQRKYIRDNYTFGTTYELFDWFDKNHFDYRGLIEKGLANDATGLNIY